MRRSTGLAFSLLVTRLWQAPNAWGDLMNGSLETGNLAGWTTSNAECYLAYADGSFRGVMPTDGSWQAFVRGGDNTNGANSRELEDFLGIARFALNDVIEN